MSTKSIELLLCEKKGDVSSYRILHSDRGDFTDAQDGGLELVLNNKTGEFIINSHEDLNKNKQLYVPAEDNWKKSDFQAKINEG